MGRSRLSNFVHYCQNFGLSPEDESAGVGAARTGGADNKFVFIGTQAFHHKAGELHYVKHNNAGTAHDTTVIEGDVNGNGKADFQIVLTGLHNLHSGDFVL